MNTQEQLEAIQDIRTMMQRSTRFISLSGMSGIIIGALAIFCGLYMHYLVNQFNDVNGTAYDYCSLLYHDHVIRLSVLYKYVFLASTLLILSIAVAVLLTVRKARRHGEMIWDETAKKVFINLLLPLFVGGVVCLVFLYHLQLYFIAPMMLIFYGFALFNTSKYTLSEIHSLGIMEMVLGLIALVFVRQGLFIWTMGFGFLHVVYGAYMFKKYDLKKA
jgi:hypothetical protein